MWRERSTQGQASRSEPSPFRPLPKVQDAGPVPGLERPLASFRWFPALAVVPAASWLIQSRGEALPTLTVVFELLAAAVALAGAVPLVLLFVKWGRKKLPKTARPWPPPFAVIDAGDGRGKSVRSLKFFLPGEVMFTEPPLVRWRNEGGFEDAVGVFLKMSDRQRLAAMSLYCPEESSDGKNSCVVSRGPLATESNKDRLAVYLNTAEQKSQETFDLAWRFLRIADLNSTTGTESSGIYEHFARMNHSCEPNCCAVIQDSSEMAWVAAADIKVGDEICTEYLDVVHSLPVQDTLLLPTAMRRERLERWGFVCQCPRCASGRDPERLFACLACGEGRFGAAPPNARHAVVPALGSAGGGDGLEACGACGAEAVQAATRLAGEAALVHEAVEGLTPLIAMLDEGDGRASEDMQREIHSLGSRAVAFPVALDDGHWLVRWLAVLGGAADPMQMQAQAPEKLFVYFKTCAQVQGMAEQEEGLSRG